MWQRCQQRQARGEKAETRQQPGQTGESQINKWRRARNEWKQKCNTHKWHWGMITWFSSVFKGSPWRCAVCETLIHFWSLLIVTGFVLFTTWAESMEGLCHAVTHSPYFLWACWVQGGISNPLIVLLLLWFANKCFLALCADSWPSSYRVCCGSVVFPSVGYSVSVFVFNTDFSGKKEWNYTTSKQSGKSTRLQRKWWKPFAASPPGLQSLSWKVPHRD